MHSQKRLSMKTSTKIIPDTPNFLKISQAFHIQVAVLRQMYRIWKKFDTLNLNVIKYGEIDDYMIELGDDIKIEQRREIEEIARRHSVDLDFTQTVQVVIKCREYLTPKVDDEGEEYVDLWLALGGDPQLQGNIQLDSIVKILKHQFDISEGIESWLSEVETTNGLATFNDLKKLFLSEDTQRFRILSVLNQPERISLIPNREQFCQIQKMVKFHQMNIYYLHYSKRFK